jgi:hypothetical protein
MANVHSPRPDTLSSPPLIVRRRPEIRAALLGPWPPWPWLRNDGGFGQAHAAAIQAKCLGFLRSLSPTWSTTCAARSCP